MDNHSFTYKSNSDGTHTGTCTWCNETVEENCSGGTATCTAKAICSTCGGSYGDLAAHSFTSTPSSTLATTATCTQAATYYVQCDNCDAVSETVTVSVGNPLGHTEQTITGTAATCTETGLTEGVMCSVCETILTPQQTIPANGHTRQTIPGKAATCTETGLTSGTRCSVCRVTLTAQQVIPTNGHTEQVIPGKAATCTETGLTDGLMCSVCQAILTEQQVIPANGHTEQVIPGKAATCTETGLTEGVECAICGDVLTAQQTLPRLAHDYRSTVTAPTCTRAGYTTYTCADCGASYTSNRTSARSHHYGEWHLNEDGTHTADCLRCDYSRTVSCEPLSLIMYMSADADQAPLELALCPVSGAVSDGTRLELVKEAHARALTERLPRGELVLRMGALANGDMIMSVAFEYAGRLTQPEGIVRISLPAERLNGYALELLNADGTQTALSCTLDEDAGELYFDLDFGALDAQGELMPARVIRLIPAT